MPSALQALATLPLRMVKDSDRLHPTHNLCQLHTLSECTGWRDDVPLNESSTAPNKCRTWPERSPSASSMDVRAARDSCTSLSSAIAVSSCSANPTDCRETLCCLAPVSLSRRPVLRCCSQRQCSYGHDSKQEASCARDRSDIKDAVQDCTWAELATVTAASCRA